MQKTYAEKVKREDYTNKERACEYPKTFSVAGDDKCKSKLWESMMRDASFYLDNPGIDEEVKMRRTLQYRYDSLFSTAMRPPLQSRKDLVQWTCAAQNAWMDDKERPELKMDCANYSGLLAKFGPNYDSIKQKLGHVKGLVTDDL